MMSDGTDPTVCGIIHERVQMVFIDLRDGKLYDAPGEGRVAAIAAEPYFPQSVWSDAEPSGRTEDGRFDTTHLSPEHAYRIGRDYLAHCIRYSYPMRVIRERHGVGARIIELGAGRDMPLFRTITHDHSATSYYKPSRYVAVDLNEFKYRPRVAGIETTLLDRCNCVTEPHRLPDEVFDLVVSFEVLEHMGKDDGLLFLDKMVELASRKPSREGKPGTLIISTPVNNGQIAKNHIYEWRRGELRRALESRGGRVLSEHGTFSNIADLVPVLTSAERAVWDKLSSYHSPHVMVALFSANHPEAARNVCWLVEV